MIELTDHRLSGDRRPGESAKAFQAVQLYLKIGPARSQRAVATQLGKQPSQIQKWATRWGWNARALSYDEHLASEEQLVRVERAREKAAVWAHRREEYPEKQFQIGQKLIAKGEQMCSLPLVTTTINDGKTTVYPAKWRLRDGLNFTNVGLKMCEQALKEDDGDSALRDEIFDFEPFKADDVII